MPTTFIRSLVLAVVAVALTAMAGPDRRAAWFEAVRSSDLATIRAMPSIDADWKDENGETALILAAQKGDLALGKTLLERGASVDLRFSFAFSVSSARSRFTSAGSSWPNRLRQPYSVWSLTLCFLDTSATDVRSASRSMATICSSVNRLFFMGSLW